MTTNLIINNQQPQPQPPTLVAVQSIQWSTGICDCFDDLQICCFGLWCCPCLTCTTSTNFGECFCLPLLDNIILCPIVAMSMRVAMRYHYKIQGDMGSDCVYAYFCNVCSWCQMAREIKRRRLTLLNGKFGT
uniref:Cornifelin-like n=1 Tax=Seriola lalandi dorsalis TaxID=1841481 RepID=A0A3B4Y704_SERLL